MLQVGIVGLPNVGKSTLFQTLTKKQVEISNRPFATINPNVAVVAVPDSRLEELKRVKITKEVVPATIEFIDIAGLVKNAHQGEGLGNQFLSHIRNVDALIHTVRIFEDKDISHVHNKIDPFYDLEIINQELKTAGIIKPTLIVFNSSENQLDWQPSFAKDASFAEVATKAESEDKPYIVLSAKLELALSEITEDERKNFINELGIKESGFEKLIKESYKLLDLITFFTIKGENQLRAWEVKKGTSIIEAAEKIHTDFKEKFIRAEVVNWGKLVDAGDWHKAREKGRIKIAGRDYVVQEGDVIEIKI